MRLVTNDMEDVIDAVMSVFKAQFADTLATIDSAKATPLSPKAPVSWIFGDIRNMPKMPAMLFTGHQTDEAEDEYDWRRQQYTLEIEAYYQHSNVEELSRIIRRYGAAIDEVLQNNPKMGGVTQEVTSIKQHYWDSLSAKNGGLFQSVNVSFDVILFTN